MTGQQRLRNGEGKEEKETCQNKFSRTPAPLMFQQWIDFPVLCEPPQGEAVYAP